MSIFTAIFLGLVQGITEFLPVSSSGHLAVLQNVFHMQTAEEGHMFFDVLLHLGTVAAAVNGPEAPFEWSAPGTIAIDARGRTTFTAHPDGRHRYLRRAGSAGDGARHIEALLERAINDQP